MEIKNQEAAAQVDLQPAEAPYEPLSDDSDGLQIGRIEQLVPPLPFQPMSWQPDPQVERNAAISAQMPLSTNRLMINYLVISLVFLGIGILIGRMIFADTATTSLLPPQVDDDPIIGAVDAPITIIEFSDFNCPYCGRFATETLPRLLEKYEGLVRFVYRDMPIIGGQISVETAIAAECAADQGKFTEYHNLLFSNTAADTRQRDVYIRYAVQLGLDEAAFTACLDDPAKSTEVSLDYIDGQEQNITGTPTFFINGRMISGAHSFDVFSTMIDQELAARGL